MIGANFPLNKLHPFAVYHLTIYELWQICMYIKLLSQLQSPLIIPKRFGLTVLYRLVTGLAVAHEADAVHCLLNSPFFILAAPQL